MVRRRSSPDPLATVDELRWLVVRDRCSRALYWVELPPKANLRVALEGERARLVADGAREARQSHRALILAVAVVRVQGVRVPHGEAINNNTTKRVEFGLIVLMTAASWRSVLCTRFKLFRTHPACAPAPR
jgi:hypothetical protein